MSVCFAAEAATKSEGFGDLPSDDRLKRVLAAAKPSSVAADAVTWADPQGRALATVVTTPSRVSLTIDRKGAPEFARFVVERLQRLYQEFEPSMLDSSSCRVAPADVLFDHA